MSVWYVGVKVEWFEEFKSHVIKADVPEELYALRNAWQQEELGPGIWKLTLNANAVQYLSDNPSVLADLRSRGASQTNGAIVGSIRGRAQPGYTLPRVRGGDIVRTDEAT